MKAYFAMLCVFPCMVTSAAPTAAESAANAAPQNAATKGEALVTTNAARGEASATNGAEQIDVYAIADPAEALEALRRK